jgi:hypothetical protein
VLQELRTVFCSGLVQPNGPTIVLAVDLVVVAADDDDCGLLPLTVEEGTLLH